MQLPFSTNSHLAKLFLTLGAYHPRTSHHQLPWVPVYCVIADLSLVQGAPVQGGKLFQEEQQGAD